MRFIMMRPTLTLTIYSVFRDIVINRTHELQFGDDNILRYIQPAFTKKCFICFVFWFIPLS